MRRDRQTLVAFAGIAALVIGGVPAAGGLEDASAAFVPVIGMGGRHRGDRTGQSRAAETKKQRIEALGTARRAGGVEQWVRRTG
jgi:hypothetical protein